MKKIFTLITVIGILGLMVSNSINAQVEVDAAQSDTAVQIAEPESISIDVEPEPEQETTLTQQVKQKFIEGGPIFMSFVLLCLIFGLALAIERIIYLNLATTNTNKLLSDIEGALQSNGIEAAKEVCRNTRGPVASIFYQGLDRSEEGIEMVEKSIISYGGVQMGLLEKNLSWISLFISIAPMLGFLGTVLGMIQAFENIRIAGDVNAGVVAGPIGVALITTASGLIVAVILQIFYNYLLSKIDSIVNNMEDSSISLVDLLVKHGLKK